MLAQVALNVVDWIAGLATGRGLGLLIPSYSTFAGYALASATFFALGYALRGGAHIRVTLVTRKLGPGARRIAHSLAGAAATWIGATLTLRLAGLAYDAWRFGDMSSGLVPTPLWIPQSVLVIGSAIFTVAGLDTLIEALRGGASPAFPDDAPEQPADLDV